MKRAFTEIMLIQRSTEWKDFRKGKIGASQVAAIMGLSPWQTKLQAWEDIVFGKEKATTEDMERGNRLEAAALHWFNEQTRDFSIIAYTPIVAQSIPYPELIASLDGWNGVELVEIKCPRKFSLKVPDHYYPQLQHQMFITNTKKCHYVEFNGNEGKILTVKRDEEFIQKMLAEELAFLSSIINFKPPAPDDKDWVEISDSERSVKLERYRELDLLIQELDEEKSMIRKELIDNLPHVRCRMGDVSFQKILRRGSYDTDRMIKDYGIDNAETYRKDPVESWRIQI